MFKLIDEYYTLVISLGGCMSADHGDGRIRGALMQQQFGENVTKLFADIKKIFDPYNILNPGIKTGALLEDVKPLLRSDYSAKQNLQHMPRM